MIIMKAFKILRTLLLVLGPLSFLVFLVTVYFAASYNPWWSFFKGAFSDLGSPRATNPWIFNIGLMTMGTIIALYSLGILWSVETKLEGFATGLLFVSGIFLFLIGYYPSGTKPHTFVSTWFYLQSFLASAFLGLALLAKKRKLFGSILFLLGILPVPLGYLIQFTIGWPSVAVLELAGALFIEASALTASIYFLRIMKAKTT